jgi:hypothetical protein
MTLCTQTITRSHHAALVLTAIMSVGLAASGCGSGRGAEEPVAPAASEGEEPPPDVAQASDPEEHAEPEERAPAPSTKAAFGRGSVVVTARVDGQPVAARIKVLEGAQGLEGTTGDTISLPAGTQRISVTIADTQSLLDKPTQNMSVFIEPGKSTPVDVTFRWARVKLDVLVGGRSQGSVPVKLFRGGEPVAELKAGGAPQAITPGKYEADVMLKGRTIHVTGLVFLEGAEQTVPVRAQL